MYKTVLIRAKIVCGELVTDLITSITIKESTKSDKVINKMVRNHIISFWGGKGEYDPDLNGYYYSVGSEFFFLKNLEYTVLDPTQKMVLESLKLGF